MGNCVGVKCKCRNESLYLGSGFSYSDIYEKASRDIKDGLYGEEMKRLMKEVKLATIDANYRAYRCEDCGYIDALVCCDLYKPNNIEVDRDIFDLCCENYGDYVLLKECKHFCPSCGKVLTKLDEEKIRKMVCPKCGEKYGNYTFLLRDGEEAEDLCGVWD